MSTITIVNQTNELVRIAIFRKPVIRPNLQTIAWQVVSPPPSGKAVVAVPADYSVFARYSMDTNNPDSPQYTSNVLSFTELTARFDISSVASQDGQAAGAVIEQKFTDLMMNEVRVVNNFGIGVWGHIQKDGVDILPPQVIWPGGLLVEDIRASLFLAVVGGSTYRGDRLIQEEFSLTETPILEGGTATVKGSQWNGYSIET